MFSSKELNKFLNKFGSVTSFNFHIYGSIRDEEIQLLTKGLLFQISHEMRGGHLLVYSDEIDEEKASSLATFQGSSLSFIFAGELDEEISEIVEEVILDGLKFLRYKSDFISRKRSVSDV